MEKNGSGISSGTSAGGPSTSNPSSSSLIIGGGLSGMQSPRSKGPMDRRKSVDGRRSSDSSVYPNGNNSASAKSTGSSSAAAADLEEFHSSKSGPCSSTRPCPSSKVEWRRNETNSAVTCCMLPSTQAASSCQLPLCSLLLSALCSLLAGTSASTSTTN